MLMTHQQIEKIVGHLDEGLHVHLNIRNGNQHALPPQMLYVFAPPERYKAAIAEIWDNKNDYIELTPLPPIEQYIMIQDFIDELPQGKDFDQFNAILAGENTFAAFDLLIQQSKYLEQWQKHRANYKKYFIIHDLKSYGVEVVE
jgi:hypothetical protein